jgi:hypothetical protein
MRSPTEATRLFRCPMCGGIVDEPPPLADLDTVRRLGECLCADELMLIFARGLDRSGEPSHEYVFQMLMEYMALAERLANCAARRGATATAAELKRRAWVAQRRVLRLREPYFT